MPPPRRAAPKARSSKIISPNNSSNLPNYADQTSTNSKTVKFNEFSSYPIVRTFSAEFRQQIDQLTIVYDDSRCFNVVFSGINSDGKPAAYGFGDNSSGCLGLGHNDPVYDQPQPIKELAGKQLVHLVSGNQFVMVVDSAGECWSWGRNSHGQLALEIEPGEINRVTIPQSVSLPFNSKSDNPVVSLVCGNAFVALLTTNGDVYTSGQNNFGQLGLSDLDYRLDFNQINLLDTISVISCGSNHLLMVTSDGTKIYACGDNRYGQLGVKMAEKVIITPVVIGSIPLKNGLHRVRTVACGANYSLVLLSNGVIYSFGENRMGQLGHSSPNRYSATPRSVDLFEFTIAIYTVNLGNLSVAKSGAGRLFCWGPIRKTGHYLRQLDWIKDGKFLTPPPGPVRARSVVRLANGAANKKPKSAQANNKATNQNKANKNGAGNDKSRDQALIKSCYISRKPGKAYCLSVQKLFALYEPQGLSLVQPSTGKWEPKKSHNGRPCTDRKTYNQRNKSDVYFKVGNQSLLAHRTILATYSEYFYRVFRFASNSQNSQHNSNQHASGGGSGGGSGSSAAGSNGTTPGPTTANTSKLSSIGSESSIIPIRDFEPETFRTYLSYLYTGTIYEKNFDPNLKQDSEWLQNIGELLELATLYEENDLIEHCIEEIVGKQAAKGQSSNKDNQNQKGSSHQSDSILSPSTVITIYNMAIEYRLERLIEICVDYIGNNWQEMLKQPDFEALRQSVMNSGTGTGPSNNNDPHGGPNNHSHNESEPIQMHEQSKL